MTPLRIEWNFTDAPGFTPTQHRLLFEGAAERWLNVVRGWPALPDGSSVKLDDGTPLRFLRVFVQFADLPSDVFAWVDTAKDKLLRLGEKMGRAAALPYEGTIQINRDRSGEAQTAPAPFKDSIVHELGHILGIGTVFAEKQLVRESANRYFFVGDAAMRAYARLLGRESGIQKIPVVRAPGASTPAYHWSEDDFKWEIMSSGLDHEIATTLTFQFNAISAISVGALEDIGYEVNMRNAEPYLRRS